MPTSHVLLLPLVSAGLAKRVKAKLLLASTSEVYGDPKVVLPTHVCQMRGRDWVETSCEL